MTKRSYSRRRRRSGTTGGGSKSPIKDGTLSFDVEVASAGKLSKGLAGKSTGLSGTTPAEYPSTENVLESAKFLEALSSILSQATKAQMTIFPGNYRTDCVVLRLEHPSGLRVCPGNRRGAHVVLMPEIPEGSSVCQNCQKES